MRVATLNLWSGRRLTDAGPVVEPDGVHRAGRRLAELEVDVVAVQEVDRGQPRSGRADQLAALADGMSATSWRFAPTVCGEPGPGRGWRPASPGLAGGDATAYGIGVASRLPVLGWRLRPLGGSRAVLPLVLPDRRVLVVPDEPRVALAAVVATVSGPVTVVCTHLSFWPPAAVRQLRRLTRWAAALPGPRVLAGDLNLPGSLPARLTGWHPLAVGATHPAPRPRWQLDHLLADRPVPADGAVSALEVSDHRCVVGTVPDAALRTG